MKELKELKERINTILNGLVRIREYEVSGQLCPPDLIEPIIDECNQCFECLHFDELDRDEKKEKQENNVAVYKMLLEDAKELEKEADTSSFDFEDAINHCINAYRASLGVFDKED